MTGPGGREEELKNFRTSNMRPQLLGPNGLPLNTGAAVPVHLSSMEPGLFPGFRGSGSGSSNQGTDSFRAILDDQRAIAKTVRDVANDLKVAADMARQFQVYSQQALANRRTEAREDSRDQNLLIERMVDAVEDALRMAGNSGAAPAPAALPAPGTPPAAPASGGQIPTSSSSPAGTGSRRRSSGGGSGPPPSGPPPSGPPPATPPTPPPGGGSWQRLYNALGGSGAAPTRGVIARSMLSAAGRNAPRYALRYAQGGVGGVARMATVGSRAIPVVGTAVVAGEVANNVLIGTTQEVRKNAQYQEMLAGSNWEGLEQRVQEQGYVWGNRLNAFGGGLTEADAREAFRGVSSLGMRDSERGNALKLVEQNYQDLGISVQRSMELLAMSAKGANMQLTGLDKSLKSVGFMARATGQNAQVLYEGFAKNYALALQMGAGPQAGAMAAGMVAVTTGMSRDLQGVDTSGQGSYFYKRRMEALTGERYSVSESKYARGDTAALDRARDVDRTQTATRALQAQGPRGMALLQQRIQEAGGGQKLADDPGALQRTALDLMGAGIDVQGMKWYMESYGGYKFDPSMSDQQITEAFVGWIADPQRGTRGAEAARAQMDQKDLNWSQEAGMKPGYGFLGLSSVEGASEFIRSNYALNPFSSEGNTKNAVLDAYSGRQHQRRKVDPVIEQLIQQVGNRSEIGIEVDTGNGKKVVDQATAIKYYGDQVAKGTARFVGGDSDYDGKLVKDVIGAERNLQGEDSTKDTADHGGQSAEDWKKDNPTEESEAKAEMGKVTISLQPGLEKIFNFQTEGGAIVDSGARAGVPPASSPVVPR